jgi:anthranilate phosphoribosyltransferase
MAECVKRVGVGFLFCRNLHPAMRFAASVRRTLGFRTVFNLLGPLTNPAGARRHVIGAPQEKIAVAMAGALAKLGSTRAMLVTGAGGIDEIGPDGFTFVANLEDGMVRNSLLDAGGEYGERHGIEAIRGGDAATNARILLSVLRGEDHGAYRAAAIENAAAAILVGGKAKTYAEGLSLAAESVDSGRAAAKLTAMLEAMR